VGSQGLGKKTEGNCFKLFIVELWRGCYFVFGYLNFVKIRTVEFPNYGSQNKEYIL